jgi:ankyrin repeat protein
MVAARDGKAALVERLLRAGADMRIVDEYMMATPVHKAAYMGYADVLRELAKYPAFAEVIDWQGPYNGYTALHDAAWHGHSEAAEVLLEAGANPTLQGHDGCTAYDLAVRCGCNELAARIQAAMKRYQANNVRQV